jgi:hypothetical protein
MIRGKKMRCFQLASCYEGRKAGFTEAYKIDGSRVRALHLYLWRLKGYIRAPDAVILLVQIFQIASIDRNIFFCYIHVFGHRVDRSLNRLLSHKGSKDLEELRRRNRTGSGVSARRLIRTGAWRGIGRQA